MATYLQDGFSAGFGALNPLDIAKEDNTAG